MRHSSSSICTLCAFAITFALCVAGGTANSATPDFPQLTGRVVDRADMLGSNAERRISETLASHEKQSGIQLVVATLPDLQGYTIETFGYQLGRHWGIGQKGKNNGVLLIVAKRERKIRIEVGYGLEGQLTDALSANIIHSVISPRFKRGQFEAGIESGVEAIISALEGSYIASKPRTDNRNKKNRIWLWIFIGFMLIPVLEQFLPDRYKRKLAQGHAYGSGWRTGGGFSSGRGGSGGGGFSGGGGGFGGGGASGGW